MAGAPNGAFSFEWELLVECNGKRVEKTRYSLIFKRKHFEKKKRRAQYPADVIHTEVEHKFNMREEDPIFFLLSWWM